MGGLWGGIRDWVGPADGVYVGVTLALLVLGAVVVGWALVWPTGRGAVRLVWQRVRRRRPAGVWCGRCGFDLSGTFDSLVEARAKAASPCPECGKRRARAGRRPLVWRRRWVSGVVAAVVLSSGVHLVRERYEYADRGWVGAVPTVVLIAAVPSRAWVVEPRAESHSPAMRAMIAEIFNRLPMMADWEAELLLRRAAWTVDGRELFEDSSSRGRVFAFTNIVRPSVIPGWYDHGDGRFAPRRSYGRVPFVAFPQVMRGVALGYDTDTIDLRTMRSRSAADRVLLFGTPAELDAFSRLRDWLYERDSAWPSSIDDAIRLPLDESCGDGGYTFKIWGPNAGELAIDRPWRYGSDEWFYEPEDMLTTIVEWRYLHEAFAACDAPFDLVSGDTEHWSGTHKPKHISWILSSADTEHGAASLMRTLSWLRESPRRSHCLDETLIVEHSSESLFAVSIDPLDLYRAVRASGFSEAEMDEFDLFDYNGDPYDVNDPGEWPSLVRVGFERVLDCLKSDEYIDVGLDFSDGYTSGWARENDRLDMRRAVFFGSRIVIVSVEDERQQIIDAVDAVLESVPQQHEEASSSD